MNSWLVHSLLAVTAIGGMMALYKVPAAKGHNKFTYSFLSFLVAAILSAIIFRNDIAIEHDAILFGSLWGLGFAFVAMLQMELLRKLDTNAVFPVTSLSSHVLIVIIGLSFFHDQISLLQMLAIMLTFIIGGFYNKIHGSISWKNGLLPMAACLVVLSTTTKFIQKFGAITIEMHNFIFWQLAFATLASFIIMLFVRRKEPGNRMKFSREMLWWSIGLGALNFISNVELVKALSTGPFSLVYTINSFYILITSLIAWKFFGEELTKRKVFFLLAAIFAVILIGLG